MDHQAYLHWTYFGGEALDKSEFDRLSELFRGVELFIDVGASHGVYTYHALQHLRGAHIISIEADPERFAILESNVATWQQGTDNTVTCVFAAATDAADRDASGGTTVFYTTGTQISGGLFPVDERSDDYRPVEVPLVTLDDFVDTGRSVLVKIDVEGGELRVLRGAEELIRRGASFFVELSWWGDRQRGTSVFSTLRFARSHGLGIHRRLRSDYLLAAEPRPLRRSLQYLAVMPALLPRYVFGRCSPYPLREWLIRRQNAKRIARMPTGVTGVADRSDPGAG